MLKTNARRARRVFVLHVREHVVQILKLGLNKIRSKMLATRFGLRCAYYVSWT
jgi:hypothetical protein